jgi:PEP-CTERM motif-containing protein
MMNSLVRIVTFGAAFAGFMFTQAQLQASPIIYTLTGTFVEATSGSDPFQLQGQNFTVTTTLDTTAVPVSTTATSDTFVSAAQFNSTFPLVGNISLTDPNAQITLDTAGTISVALAISALGQNIPVIANINIALSSPLPTPLVTSSVTGSATYGSGELATTLSLTGTLSTNPAGTPGGPEVPEPATVVLAGGGLLALALARKRR